jgi:hypothetical protein
MDEAEPAADVADEEWPPRANRLGAIRWRAEAHLDREEFFAATQTLAEAFELVGPGEGEVFRGMHHLAAAGYRYQIGEPARAVRQLAHARRRLASFPDCAERVHVVEKLLAS